jgi:ABC-2 type transport system permease protein
MTHLLKSAWVIGRRDFAATVFSKAFIFFLIGPLFPVLIGALFGGIGARVASQADKPRVAVVASHEDFRKLSSARAQLADAMDGRSVIELTEVAPKADVEAQTRELLQSDEAKVIAVLTGGLDRPHLTGAVAPDGSTASQLKVLLSAARSAPAPAPALQVTRTERATGSVNRSHSLLAQAAQFLIFFLVLILGTMTLSQLIEEKSNKVIEVLAAAVPIEAIFLGKLFAMLATSIVGIVVWTSAGAAALSLISLGGAGAIAAPAIGTVPFEILAVVYFAMNNLLLGSVFLSIGAQASTAREVQILSMPVTFGQMVIFGLASLAVAKPDSAIATAAAIFPLSSPLVMVARAAEKPELWTHLVAILWQALWIGIIVAMSARLFRRTVLKSGPARRRWWRRATA